MKSIDFKSNLNIIQKDNISKLNIMSFNQLSKIDKVDVKVKLYSSDGNIVRRYLILNKLFKKLFNQRVSIIKIQKETLRNFSVRSRRNNLSYYIVLGLSLRKNNIYSNLNYLYNIIFNLLDKNNESSLIYRKENKYIIELKNFNFLLGLNSDEDILVNNLIFKLNFIINFNNNNNKLHEKIFFKKL